MKFLRFLLFPFGMIYWLATAFRNFLFNKNVMKASKYSFPIINVGNLSMGGTGKTPHIEYLIRLLQDEFKVATLSRGYGRKSIGFQHGNKDSNASHIGDEPMQYLTKFGSKINVAVDEDRVRGMFHILGEKADTQVVLLDDAYQHRAIQAGLSILLTTYHQPYFKDFIAPVGNLRESKLGKKRADCVIVSKCPSNLSQEEKKKFAKQLKVNVPVYFSSIAYGDLVPMGTAKTTIENIVLVTGIAKPEFLFTELEQHYKIAEFLKFKDHHRFTQNDLNKIHQIFDNLAGSNNTIVTTEKDAMRLQEVMGKEMFEKYPWYYQEIKIEIDEANQFNQMVLDYVRTTRRDNELH